MPIGKEKFITDNQFVIILLIENSGKLCSDSFFHFVRHTFLNDILFQIKTSAIITRVRDKKKCKK